jgi:flagellar hook-length control protein FliK
MALNTQMNRSPVESIGQRTRPSGKTGIPGLESRTEPGFDTGRSGFAEMLQDANRSTQDTKANAEARAEARREEARQMRDPQSMESSAAVDSNRERTKTEKLSQEDTTDEGAPVQAPAETDEETAAAAAAAQLVGALSLEDEVDADAEVPPEEGRSLPVVKASRESDSRAARAVVTPTETAPLPVATQSGVEFTALNSGTSGSTGALDLLSPQELAEMDVQGEVEGGEMMERLQQALAANHTEELDKLGKPVVPQVVRSLAALARNGVSEMRLQLQPGDLGEIELRVRAVEGVIRGEVMVQHIEVKHLLDSQIERLREALEAQGMRLEGFDVGVSDDGAFAQDREADEAPSFAGLLGGESENETTATEVVSAVPRQPIQLSDDAVDWLV